MPNTQPEKLREEMRKEAHTEFPPSYCQRVSAIVLREMLITFFLAKLTASNLATREEVKREILEKMPKEKTEVEVHYIKSTDTPDPEESVLFKENIGYNKALSDLKTLISQI